MDTTFKTEEGVFNYRVCAILLQKGKILAMRDDGASYYYLPGGRVKLHEEAEAALLRELREELGITARILRPLWLNQAFYLEKEGGRRVHELCLYFLVEADKELCSRGESFDRTEEEGRHRFEWLELDRVEESDFYPLFLKKKIRELPENFTLNVEYD